MSKALRKAGAAALAAVALVTLTGCGESGPPIPTFAETCEAQQGVVMGDSTSRMVTGAITGTVFANGSSGIGTGVATSFVTITMNVCVVDGAIVDMELD